MVIGTSNVAEKLALGALLKSLGEPTHSKSFDPATTDARYLSVKFITGEWVGSSSQSTITFSDFIKAEFRSKKTTVKLNSEYSAEYIDGSDFVTVGCQKFPVSVIKELASKLS